MYFLQLHISHELLDRTICKLEQELRKSSISNVSIETHMSNNAKYVLANLKLSDDKDIVSIFISEITKALSEVINDNFKNDFIKKLVRENCDYFDYNEQSEIIKRTKKVFDKNNLYKEKIFNKLLEFLKENNIVNITGFIKFRLKDCILELEEVIDEIIDDYLIEKEYKNFIRLLKYFVEIQEPKSDLVHVITKDKGFYLLDGNLNKIKHDFLIDFKDEIINNEIDKNDLLISILISIAPKKVVIHSKDKLDVETISTLKNVFENKITFCEKCNLCSLENRYKI